MTHRPTFLAAMLFALAACTPSDDAASATEVAAPAGSDTAIMPSPPIPVGPQAARPRACDLVTAAEMSEIVGKPATASGSEPFNNQTVCSYDFGGMQDIEFQVDWGDADAAAMGIDMANAAEPGLAPGADDIGDGYAQMGPTLMIRVGDDLVTLQMVGIDDVHATARRILEVARPRM